jgi:hypothetical protein
MRRTEQYSEKLSRLYPELHEPVGTEKILTQTVTFQVTDDCNLACKYCYQTHKGKKKMSFETAKKMVDLLLSGNKGVGDYINPQKSPGLIIDFIGGACYALDGSLQAISANIFIAAPMNVDVTGDLRDEILNESTLSPELAAF